MRERRVSVISMLFGTTLLAFGSAAYAFHSGGVAECGGCHSIHNPKGGGSFLLLGADQSSTCLICHEKAGDTGPSSYHVSTALADMPTGTPPKQRTPGGDFGWLKKDYTFTIRGAATVEDGASHGHSIVAADYGYVGDPANVTAPGGTFPSAQLGCTSCHDPHGQYRRNQNGVVSKGGSPIKASGSYPEAGNEPDASGAVGVYRLLAGAGYTKGSTTFSGVPAAKAPSPYNRSEANTQTRVAYGHATSGGHVPWAKWCATCHGNTHEESAALGHPADHNLGSDISQNYNRYVKSGDMTGAAMNAFTSLVPFIENTADYALLAAHARNDNSYLNGPSTSDRVSCLSCHRSHASGWRHGLRWNADGEFMTYGGMYPGTDTTPSLPQFARGRTSGETQAAYYDRPVTRFASYQRVLCNKCHAKD